MKKYVLAGILALSAVAPVRAQCPNCLPVPGDEEEDVYTQTTRTADADRGALIGVVLGAVGLTGLAAWKLAKDTRQVTAVRRRQPWDRVY